jgi:iron-sulfur cluster repair protein YtfE (RIC family)
MYFNVGSRTRFGDVADLLIACHHRVREHLALARRIANAPASTSHESVRAAAARVRCYFGEAFALHHADEEEDLFPLLAGRSDTIDRAIAQLVADHDACDRPVAELVAVCTELERDPAVLPMWTAVLFGLVETLEQTLVAHIRLEEQTIFPAIELLSAREREGVLARMRARRDLAAVA